MKRAVTQNRCLVNFSVTAVITVCIASLGACGGAETGPEEQLRLWVGDAEEAAETKERRKLVNMISPAYADARGGDRAEVENLLRAYFFRQSSITLLTKIEEIRLYGDSAAEIDLTVGMAGQNESVLGFSADAYRFQLELERDSDDWLLLSARWAELGEELR